LFRFNQSFDIIGKITQPNAFPLSKTGSKIYFLDVRNYCCVDRFEPESISTISNTMSPNPSLTTTTSSIRDNKYIKYTMLF